MQVPLGVLPKNESCNEDMMDILEIIQDKYVPLRDDTEDPLSAAKVPAELIFFGGDQLTEERARNVQKARADGRTTLERLDATWPKNEDWHAIRTGYKVCDTFIIILIKYNCNKLLCIYVLLLFCGFAG